MKKEKTKDIFETIVATRRIIVTYDVDRKRRVDCSAVNRIVFGREVVVGLKEKKKRYRYPGFIGRDGVEQLGQSVLMMREEDAEELVHHLWKLHVPFRKFEVWLHR